MVRRAWGRIFVRDTFKGEELPVDSDRFTGDFAWLHAYCAERAGPCGLPQWSDIRLVDFPSSLLPLLVIMDVVDDARAFVFRYWGTERTNLQGVDMTGRSVLELEIPGLAAAMLEQNRRAVEARMPILYRNSFKSPTGRIIEYDALRLPVLDGADIGKVFAVSQFIAGHEASPPGHRDHPTPV
jgi:hypothetical protein